MVWSLGVLVGARERNLARLKRYRQSRLKEVIATLGGRGRLEIVW